MEMLMHNEMPIESLSILNTPSYVKHNAYGNIKYYPVLEPVTDIEEMDITEEHKKQACKFKSVEDLVRVFFEWNPEETGGHLSDCKQINFLGFRYNYYPNHKTHYGNVEKAYLILPAVARWMCAVGVDNIDNAFTDAERFPMDYKGGASKGKSYVAGDNTLTTETSTTSQVATEIVSLINPRPFAVAIANMKAEHPYEELCTKAAEMMGVEIRDLSIDYEAVFTQVEDEYFFMSCGKLVGTITGLCIEIGPVLDGYYLYKTKDKQAVLSYMGK